MALHWLLDNVVMDEIDWNIVAYPGWDRDHEAPSVLFFGTDQAAAGPGLLQITNVSTSQYMRHFRLQLRWRLHNLVTSPKEAHLSAILYVTTKGQ